MKQLITAVYSQNHDWQLWNEGVWNMPVVGYHGWQKKISTRLDVKTSHFSTLNMASDAHPLKETQQGTHCTSSCMGVTHNETHHSFTKAPSPTRQQFTTNSQRYVHARSQLPRMTTTKDKKEESCTFSQKKTLKTISSGWRVKVNCLRYALSLETMHSRYSQSESGTLCSI